MAKSEKSSNKKNDKPQKNNGDRASLNKLKTETKHGIWAVVFFVLALFFFMAGADIAGVAGKFFYNIFSYLLGIGYILLPALLVLLGASFLKSERPNIGWTRSISGILFLLSGLGMIDIASGDHAGGLLGQIAASPLVYLFDTYASIIFLGAILIISLLVMFDAKPALIPFFKNLWAMITRNKEKLDAKINSINENVEEDEEPVPEEDEDKKEVQEEVKKEKKKKEKPVEEEEELPIQKRKKSSSSYLPLPFHSSKKIKASQIPATSKQMRTSSSAPSRTSALKLKWTKLPWGLRSLGTLSSPPKV